MFINTVNIQLHATTEGK